jgi:hypothetical protein
MSGVEAGGNPEGQYLAVHRFDAHPVHAISIAAGTA